MKKANAHPENEVTTPSPRSTSSQGSTTHKYVITADDLEKVSTRWLQILKDQAMGMRKKGETISFSIPKGVFFNEQPLDVLLDYEDMLDWCFQKSIGAAHLNIFMK